MSLNKEELTNKIIYRASYRGTKEMDILMLNFTRSIISNLDFDHLIALNELVNMNDEDLILIKKKESTLEIKDKFIKNIVNEFQKF
tara:strand:- start:31 stop:288 length:258 start_codon:yes stop_codon:yes gene_type:complete